TGGRPPPRRLAPADAPAQGARAPRSVGVRGGGRLPVQPHPGPRRSVWFDAETVAGGPASALRGLARTQGGRSDRRVRGDRRLSPRTRVSVRGRARAGRRRGAGGGRGGGPSARRGRATRALALGPLGHREPSVPRRRPPAAHGSAASPPPPRPRARTRAVGHPAGGRRAQR